MIWPALATFGISAESWQLKDISIRLTMAAVMGSLLRVVRIFGGVMNFVGG